MAHASGYKDNHALYIKCKIIDYYAMGISCEKISDLTSRSLEHIQSVLNEYNNEGTISVNSKLNRIK